MEWGQIKRGPDLKRSRTGILWVSTRLAISFLRMFRDLKGIAKVATGVLILRRGNSTAWSPVDNDFNEWCKKYLEWLENTDIAIEESFSDK